MSKAESPTPIRDFLRDAALHFIEEGYAAELLFLVEQSLKGEAPEDTDVPEDTTPRVGDTVRVRAGARHCAGMTLVMVGRRFPDQDDFLATRSGKTGTGSGDTGHFGPLSDFELVERAELEGWRA